ncbi:patatin-like phospholipase family protein [candidate division KSB1 bacterium]
MQLFLRKVIVILIILLPFLSFGQKVGLVLSGGGSRGMAHIGVLKAIEDNEIPIDYIAGTSIGALIGGLYACGYSPLEIEEMIINDDFLEWSRGIINKKYIFYFKKPPLNASWINFKYRFKEKLQSTLPTNLVSTAYLDFAFMEMFAGSDIMAKQSFDSLFIPFRCVVADIENNKSVVLKQGSIGKAVRASISFPFVIKPIEIDNVLMFDGGMYNNFPSDVVYNDFFPDIIIGSKVAGNYDAPEAQNILSQVRNMLMANTEYTVVCDNGVLIEPEVEKVRLLDFTHSKEFIDSGYAATSRKIDEIRMFITDSLSINERKQRRETFRQRIPSLMINKIYTIGLSEKQGYYVDKLLRRKADFVTPDQMKTEYFKLIADDKISAIVPIAVYNHSTGFYDMFLDVEKGEDVVLQFGGNFSSSPINGAFLEIQYNTLGKVASSYAVNFNIGRFYSSFDIRTRIDFPSKLPFYTQLVLSFNQWDYFKTNTYFFEDKKPSYLIQNDNNTRFDIGFPVGNTGKIIGGITIARIKDEYYQTSSFLSVDTTDVTFFDLYSPHIVLEFNSLNRKQYANRGAYLRICGKYISGMEEHIPGSTSLFSGRITKYHDWYQFKLKYDNYFESIGKIKLGFYSEIMITNQKLFSNYSASILSAPAFQPIPESKTLFLPTFRAHSYAGAGLKLVRPLELINNFDIRLEGYIFQPYQAIIENDNHQGSYGDILSDKSYIGSSTIVFHSPFGPVSLSLNYYPLEKDPWSLIFNFGYLIFNHRTLE